jgi:hypothetical protein
MFCIIWSLKQMTSDLGPAPTLPALTTSRLAYPLSIAARCPISNPPPLIPLLVLQQSLVQLHSFFDRTLALYPTFFWSKLTCYIPYRQCPQTSSQAFHHFLPPQNFPLSFESFARRTDQHAAYHTRRRCHRAYGVPLPKPTTDPCTMAVITIDRIIEPLVFVCQRVVASQLVTRQHLPLRRLRMGLVTALLIQAALDLLLAAPRV